MFRWFKVLSHSTWRQSRPSTIQPFVNCINILCYNRETNTCMKIRNECRYTRNIVCIRHCMLSRQQDQMHHTIMLCLHPLTGSNSKSRLWHPLFLGNGWCIVNGYHKQVFHWIKEYCGKNNFVTVADFDCLFFVCHNNFLHSCRTDNRGSQISLNLCHFFASSEWLLKWIMFLASKIMTALLVQTTQIKFAGVSFFLSNIVTWIEITWRYWINCWKSNLTLFVYLHCNVVTVSYSVFYT